MTPKQRRFAIEYLKDLNGKQAAIRAGYSPRSAEVTASKLLRVPKVRDLIDQKTAKVEAKGLLVVEDLERKLQEILDFNPKDLYRPVVEDGVPKVVDGQQQYEPIPLPELPDRVARALAGFDVEELFEGASGEKFCVGRLRKWKRWDPARALELAMKRRGMLVDRSQVELTGVRSVTVNIGVKKPEAK